MDKITRVYDYAHAQREQERALEMYRQLMAGGGAAAGASPAFDTVDEDVLVVDDKPTPSPAPAPRPPARPLPVGLQPGGGDTARGALQLGAPPLASRAAASAPRATSLAAMLAARAPPRPPPKPAAVLAHLPARAAAQHLSSAPLSSGGGVSGFKRAAGRRRAGVVNSISQQELQDLLPMGVAAWRVAYEYIYGQATGSGNLVWLQRRLRDAVGDGSAEEEDEE